MRTITAQEAVVGREWAIMCGNDVYDLYRDEDTAKRICNDLSKRYTDKHYEVAHIE